MKILHLVKVRFDIRKSSITQEWLEKRFQFFLDYTYKSLLSQTSTNWILWINCQEGMEKRIDTLRNKLDIERVVFSFGDAPIEISGEYDYVYVTRIDSDDLYAPDALETIKKHKPLICNNVEGLIFQKGYLHSLKTNQTGIYFNPSSPFHTLMIPFRVWKSQEEYGALWKRIGDHSRVSRELYCRILPDYKFTVLIHDNNFLSTYDYSRQPGYVEKNWSIDLFLDRPVVFDLDDFCDELGGYETLEYLDMLKVQYPNFRCTLFGIPAKCSSHLLKEAQHRVTLGWLELGLHGWDHYPTEELKQLSPTKLGDLYRTSQVVNHSIFTKGFRPPGWYIRKDHIQILNDLGMWVAIHKRDKRLCVHAQNGFYICEDRYPYFHGHTHNTCGNWIREMMPTLMTKWHKHQKFAKVSEALCVSSY